jgi:copper homeostasis protein (lipoprotein)
MTPIRIAVAVVAFTCVCTAAASAPRAADTPRRIMSPLAELPATWTGQVQGQAWQLDLLPMGRWQLRQGAADSLGGYALEGDVLSLQQPEAAPIVLRLGADGSLRASAGATLKREATARPFEPRLVLDGWFTYFADAPRMVLCADGRSLPVQQAGDYLALERAYLAARPAGNAPGAPLWAKVEALIAPRPAMEPGQPPQTTLVVQRFERIDATGRCAGLRADRPLEGTEWRPFAGPPRATLRFSGGQALGNDGCNRFMGRARIDGSSLALGPLVRTEMACLQGQAEADAFGSALPRARRYEIRGDWLELRDDKGQPLVQLRALDEN